jgi:hypothetical protein
MPSKQSLRERPNLSSRSEPRQSPPKGAWLSERRLFLLAAAFLVFDVLALGLYIAESQPFTSDITMVVFLGVFAILLYQFRRRRNEPIGTNFAM